MSKAALGRIVGADPGPGQFNELYWCEERSGKRRKALRKIAQVVVFIFEAVSLGRIVRVFQNQNRLHAALRKKQEDRFAIAFEHHAGQPLGGTWQVQALPVFGQARSQILLDIHDRLLAKMLKSGTKALKTLWIGNTFER